MVQRSDRQASRHGHQTFSARLHWHLHRRCAHVEPLASYSAKRRLQEPIVKLQAITLGAKLLVLSPADRTLILLNRYVLSLARYDMNFDVRDRARMLGALLIGAIPGLQENDEEQETPGGVVLRREQVRLVLFDGKLGPPAEKDVLREFCYWQAQCGSDVPVVDFEHQTVGSLGAITGKDMAGDSVFPDWLESGVDPALRDSEDDAPPPPISVQSISSAVPRSIASSNRASPIVLTPTGPSPSGSYVRTDAKNTWTDLDKFYEDTHEEDEEEETESEEDESEEESERGEVHAEHHEGPESSEPEESGEDESGEEDEEEDHDNSHHAIHHAS